MKNTIAQLKTVNGGQMNSYVVTTADGAVIVIDGGYRCDAEYLLSYLRDVTGETVPHVDAWILSHAHGGSQQIGARISYNEIDMVIFFNDPHSTELDTDLSYISKLCDQHNVPMATNAATAEMLIHGLARGDLDWREVLNPHAPLKV